MGVLLLANGRVRCPEPVPVAWPTREVGGVPTVAVVGLSSVLNMRPVSCKRVLTGITQTGCVGLSMTRSTS